MAMVVRTNNMAVNANRQLGMNNSKVANSLEKLASGFRINRAGDDASGLAISEKMKAQIKGLQTASANSQDGISLIQTAEGALTEVHDMLNRMVEIAGKSANGTMDDSVDRASLEKELNSLKSEVDRIAESTNFNGKKLLDGSLAASGAGAVGVPTVSGLRLTDNEAVKYKSAELEFANIIANSKFNGAGKHGEITLSYTDAEGNDRAATISIVQGVSAKDGTTKVLIGADGTEYSMTDAGATQAEVGAAFAAEANRVLGDTFKVAYSSAGKLQFEAKEAGANTKITGVVENAVAASGVAGAQALIALGTAASTGSDAYQSFKFSAANYDVGDSTTSTKAEVFSVGGQKFAFVNTADDLADLDNNVNGVVLATASSGVPKQDDVDAMAALIEQKTGYKPTATLDTDGVLEFRANASTNASGGGGLTLQIGDTAEAFNKVTVSIRDMSTKGLGISGISVADEASASIAITQLKNTKGDNEYGAINMVSSVRADLGALQNRLDHTIANLDVAAENMTAANSRIRDTDMANQMMEYTKMNVLTQAAQAMLAQANSAPQSVLQLLQ